MPGLFDNKLRQYIEAEWLDGGQWLEDEDGYLYIIPQQEVVADAVGPDGPILGKLCEIMQEHGYICKGVAAALKLTIIPDVLKRFDPGLGYYHA